MKHERVAGEILEHCQNSGCWELCDQQDAIDSIAAIILAEYGPVEDAVHTLLDYELQISGSPVSYPSLYWTLAKAMDRLTDNGDGTGQIKERT